MINTYLANPMATNLVLQGSRPKSNEAPLTLTLQVTHLKFIGRQTDN